MLDAAREAYAAAHAANDRAATRALARKLDVADQNPWSYPFAIRCTVPVATPNCAAIL
jgi:hypothetical protein